MNPTVLTISLIVAVVSAYIVYKLLQKLFKNKDVAGLGVGLTLILVGLAFTPEGLVVTVAGLAIVIIALGEKYIKGFPKVSKAVKKIA